MKFRQFLKSDLAFLGLLAFLLVMTAGGHIVQGDEETMFRVTQSIFEKGRLDVGGEEIVFPSQSAHFLPSNDELILTTSGVPGRDGLYFSKYGIGQSIAAIPLYILGSWVDDFRPDDFHVRPQGWDSRLWVAMLNPLVLAGCGWLAVSFGKALGYSTRTSRWIAFGAVFSTFLWPYVKTFYSQPGAAFMLLGAVTSAFRWKQTRKKAWLWWFSAACAGIILFRISAVLILPAFLIYFIFFIPESRLRDWIFPFVLGTGLALGITAGYNWLRFGSFLTAGYDEIAWTTPLLYGLYGLLFSAGKGVVFYAPLLVLSLIAGILFASQHRGEAVLILSLWVTYLAFYAPHNYWTGGFNWGPRFLLPVIPLAFIPLGSLLEDNTIRGAKSLFFVLFGLGIFLQIPAIIVDQSRFLYQHFEETQAPEAYSLTIEDFSYSPLINQWKVSVDLLRAYSIPATWGQARSALTELSWHSTAGLEARAVLVSDFLRRNTIDFWWIHLYLLR